VSDDTHLRALEAESIHIMREVVAEFERPVMLYSIGKDSSVLLRLAQKAFFPGPIPFPLLHVDTTYKFREMIEFRDRYVQEIGARLIVHTNTEAIADGTQPFLVGTQRCCGALKTKSLARCARGGRLRRRGSVAPGAMRSGSRAKERIFSLRDANGQWDPKRAAAGALESAEWPDSQRGEHHGSSRCRIGPKSTSGLTFTSRAFPSFRSISRRSVRSSFRGESLISLEQPFVPLLPGERPQRIMCRMRSLGCSQCTGRGALERGYCAEDHRRAHRGASLRTPAPRHRPRSGRVDGAQKARGILLVSGLLRICTAGSVDDGKSNSHRTAAVRLEVDIYEDQVHSVEKASKNRSAGTIDFSLFTDGLKAEREQGITIDVAYRYFATARRKFILADTPGHEQYTRNMANWRVHGGTSRFFWWMPATACASSRGATPRSRACSALPISFWL